MKNPETLMFESARWAARQAKALVARCHGRRPSQADKDLARELAGRLKVSRQELELYCD